MQCLRVKSRTPQLNRSAPASRGAKAPPNRLAVSTPCSQRPSRAGSPRQDSRPMTAPMVDLAARRNERASRPMPWKEHVPHRRSHKQERAPNDHKVHALRNCILEDLNYSRSAPPTPPRMASPPPFGSDGHSSRLSSAPTSRAMSPPPLPSDRLAPRMEAVDRVIHGTSNMMRLIDHPGGRPSAFDASLQGLNADLNSITRERIRDRGCSAWAAPRASSRQAVNPPWNLALHTGFVTRPSSPIYFDCEY